LGRGPSLKTKKKHIKAEIIARYDAIKKWYKKNPQAWLNERFSSLVSNTSLMDMAKLAAILGMTLIVKNILDSTEELREKLVAIMGQPLTYLRAIGPMMIPVPFAPSLEAAQLEAKIPEVLDWVIAFCLAWLIVDNFGDIMRTVGDVTVGVKGILTGLLIA